MKPLGTSTIHLQTTQLVATLFQQFNLSYSSTIFSTPVTAANTAERRRPPTPIVKLSLRQVLGLTPEMDHHTGFDSSIGSTPILQQTTQPPANLTVMSPPTATTSPDTASNKSAPGSPEYPTGKCGIINHECLYAIQGALQVSDSQQDAYLATWINNNFFTPPPGPEKTGTRIETAETFSNLFEAYQRVQFLTNRAVDKWPFFAVDGKSMMTKKAVKNWGTAEGEGGQSIPLNGMSQSVEQAPVSAGPIKQLATTPAVSVPASPLPRKSVAKDMPHGNSTPTFGSDINVDHTLSPVHPLSEPNNDIPAAAHAPSPAHSAPNFDTIHIAASAEPVATNLDKLPMSSSLNKSKRKSDTSAGPRKKPRGGKAISTPRKIPDADESPRSRSPSLTGLMTNRPQSSRGRATVRASSGRFASKSSSAPAPASPIAARSTQQLYDSVYDFPTRSPSGEHITNSPNLADEMPATDTAAPTVSPALSASAVSGLHTTTAAAEGLEDDMASLGMAQPIVKPSGTPSPATAMMKQFANMIGSSANTHTDVKNSAPREVSLPTPVSNDITIPSNSSAAVEFFARIQTPNGAQEIPLSAKHFADDNIELIQRYAEWKQQEEGMDLSFEQFSKIFGFAKMK
ncbi:hypothetical protein K505DRAFT_320431 [Melanomma pulvis-pyrius CBS 109.77]|uniref:Uncharacterized protein n=1 Tax=Melanomma pulvis-pyrius CBS 109.77 TaxID=1314802 RepID=A0A6A6XW18_9PLEO|nr:hypothetical protein K505DRAFT_320431 [Melanomma pulvis-pyrius CBS 109.77]